MESVTPREPTTFSLRGSPHTVTLEDEGLRHPTGARLGGMTWTAYRDITHLATSARAIWLGTRRSVYVISRRTFGDPHGPEHLVRALLAQIARLPGGSAQLARMAEIEEAGRGPTRLRATWTLFAACAAIYAVQLFGGDIVMVAGYFTAGLTAAGDWWRVVTGNLLHANALHLVVNLLGLLAVGSLVERALGTAATTCVMAGAGIGAMAASAEWSAMPVVGVSGILSGLLAALVWLELRFPDVMPAWWRVPRRALFGVIGLTALSSLVPFVAAAAHAGGFVAGGITTAAVAWNGPRNRPAGIVLRALAGASTAVAALAIAVAGDELIRPGEFAARHVVRLDHLPGATAEELNRAAWMIATRESSSPELLEVALSLAERAAADTAHADAEILDTLAEVHFQLGHRAEAITAIDEAIQHAPDRDDFRAKRRRFLGESEPADRPTPPESPAARPEEPGLSV